VTLAAATLVLIPQGSAEGYEIPPHWDREMICSHPKLRIAYREECSAPPIEQPSTPTDDTRDTIRTDSVWDRLAQCESGGNWQINTGNGYYGGLQIGLPFWRAYGGREFAVFPHQATREEQIIVAERGRDAAGGYRPWPACSRRLGLPR
jgi:hypothetical protein